MKSKNLNLSNFNIESRIKTIILSLAMLFSLVSFSQTEPEKKTVKTTNVQAFSLEITIDSIEELESIFMTEDLEELFLITEDNEDITFTLNCNFKEAKDKMEGHISYTIKGNTNDKEKLVKSLEKVKTSALKFYKSKNKN